MLHLTFEGSNLRMFGTFVYARHRAILVYTFDRSHSARRKSRCLPGDYCILVQAVAHRSVPTVYPCTLADHQRPVLVR